MTEEDRGHRDIDHTADWALDIWAPELESLFEEAAIGMYGLSGVKTEDTRRISRTIELERSDRASLLVGFLSEILYWLQADRVAFDNFQLHCSDVRLEAHLTGGPLVSVDKEIKAVTWHDLRVELEETDWEARVTFDV